MKQNLFKNTFFYLLFLSLNFILMNIVKVQAETLHSEHKSHNLFGSHGMVLIHDNEQGFYASHLPLYTQPHHYQLVYKIETNTPEKLLTLLKTGMVTMLPDNFDLTRLVQGERFSINTAFFQGHFERGGKKIFNTNMAFEKPILIKKVNPSFFSTSSTFYLVPISDKQSLVSHKIQQAPSFDAIGLMNNAEIISNNETEKEEGIRYLTCNKPSLLTLIEITTYFKTCQNFNVNFNFKYIETQDFK